MSTANAFSDYVRDAAAKWLFKNTAPTVPATLYVALFTTTQNSANSSQTEVTGGSYARGPIESEFSFRWPEVVASSGEASASATATVRVERVRQASVAAVSYASSDADATSTATHPVVTQASSVARATAVVIPARVITTAGAAVSRSAGNVTPHRTRHPRPGVRMVRPTAKAVAVKPIEKLKRTG
jgi:hypothetical protein